MLCRWWWLVGDVVIVQREYLVDAVVFDGAMGGDVVLDVMLGRR